MNRQFEALEAELDWLELHGTSVDRIDPTVDAAALDALPEAARAWHDDGSTALPMVVADGHMVTRGRVPSHREFIHLAASHEPTCSTSTLRHVAALAVAAAMGREDVRARERAQAQAAGLEPDRLDAVEDEARRMIRETPAMTR